MTMTKWAAALAGAFLAAGTAQAEPARPKPETAKPGAASLEIMDKLKPAAKPKTDCLTQAPTAAEERQAVRAGRTLPPLCRDLAPAQK